MRQELHPQPMGTEAISVVLATYNGEAYIAEQLRSLSLQTRPPDEVIIIDDASSDATPILLEAFVKSAPFPVHLTLRPTHLGTWATFEEGLRKATGPILVICDQDDRWRPSKLSILASRLSARPDAQMAFSDADLINAEGQTIGRSRWRVAGFSQRSVESVAVDPLGTLLARQAVSGCTLAIRSDLLPAILPFPADIHPALPVMMYDRWISLVAAAYGRVEAIPEKLVEYRIHRTQQIGIPALSIRRLAPRLALHAAQFLHGHHEVAQRVEYHIAHLDEIAKRLSASGLMSAQAEEVLNAADRHLRVRAGLDRSRVTRLRPVLRELRDLNGYRRFSLGSAAAVADLVR